MNEGAIKREQIRRFCLSKAGVTEEFPFDDVTWVYKVSGKMFALLSSDEDTLSLKCDPDIAIELRANFEDVQPGWHMNKKHWVTVQFAGELPIRLIQSWISNSYTLVVAKLPKVQQMTLREKEV